jgi:hypothetical protein
MSRDGAAVALATIDASEQGHRSDHVDHETEQARCDFEVTPKDYASATRENLWSTGGFERLVKN